MTTAPLDRRPLYRHRQTGWPMLVSACVPFVCLAAWSAVPPDDRMSPPHLLALTGGCVLIVLGFSWLTTVVTRTHLVFRFGIGLVRRTIPLARIHHVCVTRTRWYEGWGIHWTRRGMLYNVGGFDAVAIELDTGRTLRIGSDDAARLKGAIERAIADGGPASPPRTDVR